MTRTARPGVTSGRNRANSSSAASRIENYLASFVEAKKIELFPAISVPWIGILMIRSINSAISINRKMRVELTELSLEGEDTGHRAVEIAFARSPS